MQVCLQDNQNEDDCHKDEISRNVEDAFNAFVQLNKKVKMGKLLKNFAVQVQTDQATEASRQSLCNSLQEIKDQFDDQEAQTILPLTTQLLERSINLNQIIKDKIVHEILLFAQLNASKTVKDSVKCSLTLALSQVRKLAKFIKEVRRETLDSNKNKETFDEVKRLVNRAEENCNETTKLMEKYDSLSTNETEKQNLLEKIKQQRDLILTAYETILDKMSM